jgi:hypothetical protein
MVSHAARMSSAAMSAVTGDSHSRADPVLQVVDPLGELMGALADRGGEQQAVGDLLHVLLRGGQLPRCRTGTE